MNLQPPRPPRPKRPLSPRQLAVLRYVAEYVDEHGYPPTIREIGRACDISSTSVVGYHVGVLEDRTMLTSERRIPRSLRVTEHGYRELGIKPPDEVLAIRDDLIDQARKWARGEQTTEGLRMMVREYEEAVA